MRTPAPDQHERDLAVNPEHSVIVQAPAGSGKTSLLVERYLRLLAGAQRPEEILAITFTRKAAAEMRSRALAALAQDDSLARAVNERGRELGWDLRRHPQRLKIQTIDSFAMSLLRQLPLAGAFDPGAQLLEAADHLYERAATELFRGLYDSHPLAQYIADLLAWLDNDHQRGVRLVAGMLARRDQWLDVVQSIVAAEQQAPERVSALLSQGLEALATTVQTSFESRLDATQLGELSELVGSAAQQLDLTPANAAERYQLAARVLLTGRDEPRKTLTKREGFPPSQAAAKAQALALLGELERADSIAALARLKHLPAAAFDPAQRHRIVSVCICLTLATVELNRLFTAERVCDFAQLTLSARTALGTDEAPSELAMALDYRIRHILVDEFQDTSLTQFELLGQLVAGWEPESGNSFFAVGDPMQSIYRFRDADVGLFYTAWHHGLAHIKLQGVRLRANFRATAGLVEWTNSTFAPIFGEVDDPLVGQVAFSPATATRREQFTDPASVEIYPDQPQQIAGIVSTVAQLQHTQPAASIAVLVRSRTHLTALLPALRGAGLSWHGNDIERLTDNPVVSDLLALARVLWAPWDRVSWFAVLRAPYVGLTLRELEAFAATENFAAALYPAPGELKPETAARLAALDDALRLGYGLRGEASPRQVLESTWLRAGGRLAVETDTDLLAAQRLFEVMDALGPKAADPTQLERSVGSLYANDPTPSELQILTIHKAKGLQFDHVVLPFLERQPQRSDAPLLRWRAQGSGLLMGIKGMDEVHPWLSREDQSKERHELQRLFYVACTRARNSLHLFATLVGDKQPNRDSLLSLLAVDGALTEQDSPPPAAEPVQTDMFRGRLFKRLTQASRTHTLQQPRRGLAEGDPIAADTTADDERAALGTMVHEVLHSLALQHPLPDPEQLIASHRGDWKDRAHALGVSAAAVPSVLETLSEHIRTVLADPKGRWLLQAHDAAESEFPLTGLVDGATRNVILDRMFVDAGERWVVEYKSTSSVQSPDQFQAEIARHLPQLQQYRTFAAAAFAEPIRVGIYFTAIGHFAELTNEHFH